MNIEKYLVLNKHLLSLFGVDSVRSLLDRLRDCPTGTDSDGRTHYCNVLRSSLEGLKIAEDDLLRYDQNIQLYERRINFRREPVKLKYFQYLSVLFAEVVLDNLKNRKPEFLHELNQFLEDYKQGHSIEISAFNENDLRKLAFWMATGSGKTLIMHMNYYQFFSYKLFLPDNIILITPNEGLSKQHFEELEKSGIPCRLYTGNLGTSLRSESEVLVIEMTKFVEEKKGSGVTLPVEAFEGRNLVFVDEGHKGRRSEEQKWAQLRNRLAEDGFVFEYSATFGQILSESQPDILEEYAKSIVFDYSYKYFYLDGYGKDFSILNVKRAGMSEEEFGEGMFVANLLSFYEQLIVYEENERLAKEHNLEKPLWIFVGTTVTGKDEESDVIQIVEFFRKVFQDEGWANEWAHEILGGNLRDQYGRDIFHNKFQLLRSKGVDFADLYNRVFGGRGRLAIYELKNAEGELGLKVAEHDYFGVINIGDVAAFKKQLEKNGITVEQDAISGSLFDNIKRPASAVNILIGSKKFIEGWDTWRVSSMGLLNIGRGQGPQIIQLFGRGVRLKGKDMSLRRSGTSPEVKVLETLNIYGIKADYLTRFLEAIQREEVELETIEIPVKLQHQDRWQSLYLPAEPDQKFEEEEVLRLEIDDRLDCRLNLTPSVAIYAAKGEMERAEIEVTEIKAQAEQHRFSAELLELFDWDRIWQETVQFKTQRGYWNLVFDPSVLKAVLLSGRCTVMARPEVFEVKDVQDLQRLEETALLAIKKYLDLFYNKSKRRFATQQLRPVQVRQLPLPLISDRKHGYTVQVEARKKDLITKIRELAKDLEKLAKEDAALLPRIYFDGSLYVPLLLESSDIAGISPAGLVKSERDFVYGLRNYLKSRKEKLPAEVYLLRNYPLSGIGFQLQWARFYPDFIMWLRKKDEQTIVFVDPKGLQYSKGLDDEKVVFAGFKESSSGDAVTIKEVEQKMGKGIRLESFILSATPYNKLIAGLAIPPKKEEYISHHVLFLEDNDWPEKLFTQIGLEVS